MEREQFTFYASFSSALQRIKRKSDRCDAYDAITLYALYGREPDLEHLPDSAALAFDLIRPILDKAAERANSGKSGGKAKRKQTGSKPEANHGKSESKKEGEGEIEVEREIEIEKENDYLLKTTSLARADGDQDLAAVMSYYLDHINPSPSASCIEDLKFYAANMPVPVILHAFHYAQDERKTAWSYIRAILQSYLRDGLTDLEAVLAREQARKAEKAAEAVTKKAKKGLSAAEYDALPKSSIDMEQLRKLTEKI